MKAIEERLKDVRKVYVYGDPSVPNRYEAELVDVNTNLYVSIRLDETFTSAKRLVGVQHYLRNLVRNNAMLLGQNVTVVGCDGMDDRVVVIKGYVRQQTDYDELDLLYEVYKVYDHPKGLTCGCAPAAPPQDLMLHANWHKQKVMVNGVKVL